jgi:hypothetical protein
MRWHIASTMWGWLRGCPLVEKIPAMPHMVCSWCS